MRFKGAVLVLLAFGVAAPVAMAAGAMKANLTRPAADAPDEDGQGWLKLKERKGAELFSVKVRRLESDSRYDLYIEDGAGFTRFGQIDTNRRGCGRYKVNTRRGDVLPLGAESAAALAGRTLEVRFTDGGGAEHVVLHGSLPEARVKPGRRAGGLSLVVDTTAAPIDDGTGEDPPPEDDATDDEEEEITGDGCIKVKSSKCKQVLTVKLREVPPGTYPVFMEDEDGDYEQVGSIVIADDEDSGKFEADTHHGDPLPFDAEKVADLAGRGVEVRTTGGQVVFSGTVPDVDDGPGKKYGHDSDHGGKRHGHDHHGDKHGHQRGRGHHK